MKLSISNIAWPNSEEEYYLSKLIENGFTGIEVAPSKIWDNFEDVSSNDRSSYHKYIASFGLEICSMHSLFWTSRNASMFGDADKQKNFSDYFRKIIEFASDMNIPKMIFGSPAVRRRGSIGASEGFERAAEVLFPISEYAFQNGTKILVEPLLPSETDFITNHKEGMELVKCVNSKGFGLHLDAKAICGETDPVNTVIADCKDKVEHFHVNEAALGSFEDVLLPHETISQCLREINYTGYVSIEMKQSNTYSADIDRALDYVRKVYG